MIDIDVKVMKFIRKCIAAGLLVAVGTSHAETTWKRIGDQYGLDPLVLYAIALQESRMLWPDQAVRPQPWTLRAASGALRFPSYEQAGETLDRLVIDEGQTNVDIGMMQLNWKWTRGRGYQPRELLQPLLNLTVAATILRENLNMSDGNLWLAVSRYHNWNPAIGTPYAQSVKTTFERLRDTGFAKLLEGRR